MPKDIKFIASGSCSALGNFADGDIARNLPDDLADHLVNEASCARFLERIEVPADIPVRKRSKRSGHEES